MYGPSLPLPRWAGGSWTSDGATRTTAQPNAKACGRVRRSSSPTSTTDSISSVPARGCLTSEPLREDGRWSRSSESARGGASSRSTRVRSSQPRPYGRARPGRRPDGRFPSRVRAVRRRALRYVPVDQRRLFDRPCSFGRTRPFGARSRDRGAGSGRHVRGEGLRGGHDRRPPRGDPTELYGGRTHEAPGVAGAVVGGLSARTGVSTDPRLDPGLPAAHSGSPGFRYIGP